MKRSGLSLGLTAATLFLANSLGAQEPAGGAMTPAANAPARENAPSMRMEGRAAEMLKRFDTNGDGRIDDDERAEAKGAMVKEQVDRQMARAALAQATPEQFRTRLIELFDTNRDGRLDDEERAAAQKMAEDRPAGITPAFAALREELVKRFDKNANGRLDPEEREAVRDYAFARPAAAAPEAPATPELESTVRAAIEASAALRERFDADKDGKFNDAEWARVRAELAQAFRDRIARADPGAEQRRLDAVAAEVQRRRRLRESVADAAPDKAP